MKVAIFFGSKSDTETMKKSADVLKEFGVDYKAFIISAHRAGELLVKTIRQIDRQQPAAGWRHTPPFRW